MSARLPRGRGPFEARRVPSPDLVAGRPTAIEDATREITTDLDSNRMTRKARDSFTTHCVIQFEKDATEPRRRPKIRYGMSPHPQPRHLAGCDVLWSRMVFRHPSTFDSSPMDAASNHLGGGFKSLGGGLKSIWGGFKSVGCGFKSIGCGFESVCWMRLQIRWVRGSKSMGRELPESMDVASNPSDVASSPLDVASNPVNTDLKGLSLSRVGSSQVQLHSGPEGVLPSTVQVDSRTMRGTIVPQAAW